MRIDSNGRVVIGHTAASTNYGKTLHIHNSASAGASVHLTDSTTGTSNSDGFELVMHSQTAYVINREPSALIFMTNGTNERLRIKSDGKLSTGGETAPDVSAGGLCLNQGSESANILSFKSSDINHGRTAVDETDTWFSIRKVSDNKGGAFIHGYTDQTGGDPAIHIAGYIESQGTTYRAIQLTGARKNSSNTGSSPFQSGYPIVRISNDFDTTVASFTPDGLAFNDDRAAANSLGDYEEGTWTGGFNDYNGSYSQNTGLYTKIGDLVTVSIMVSGSGHHTGSGSLILTSLPFASQGTPSSYRAVGSVHAHTGLVTGGKQIIGLMNNNENKVRIRTIENNSTTTDLNRNGLNSGGWEVVVTITYQTAS